jgi:hemolysin activation/secretion protein
MRFCPLTCLLALTQCFSLPLYANEKKTNQVDLPSQKKDDEGFLIANFDFKYDIAHPSLPSLEEIENIVISLGKTELGYVGSQSELDTVNITLKDLKKNNVPRWFARSALQEICNVILKYHQQRDIGGVKVKVMPSDVQSPELSAESVPSLNVDIIISVSPIGKIRTVTQAENSQQPEESNLKQHRNIIEQCPIQEQDLLAPEVLEDYIFFVNRYPNRRVEMVVGAVDRPDVVGLDFVITENKPWRIYANVANTGPKGLNRWQEIVGYINTQLTGHDDILQIDASTDSFNQFHSEFFSYERPFAVNPRVRWKLQANYSQFSSAQLGIMKKEFVGKQAAGAFEVDWNAYQYRDFFFDVFGALQYRYIYVHNRVFHVKGHENFLLPIAGIQLSRFRNTSRFFISIDGQTSLNGITDIKTSDLDRLGRLGVDKQWYILRENGYVAFFLEPLFSSKEIGYPDMYFSRLANEIFLSVSAQYAGRKRLIPEFQSIVGGLYSVRGYPTATAAGDNTGTVNIEYLLHIPQLFKTQPHPHHKLFGKTFRIAPDCPGGRADWDLILRGFFDAARAVNNKRQNHRESNFEISDPPSATLLGTGFGTELTFRQNFFLRTDFGWALKKADRIPAGHFEFYLSGTLMY